MIEMIVTVSPLLGVVLGALVVGLWLALEWWFQ